MWTGTHPYGYRKPCNSPAVKAAGTHRPYTVHPMAKQPTPRVTPRSTPATPPRKAKPATSVPPRGRPTPTPKPPAR